MGDVKWDASGVAAAGHDTRVLALHAIAELLQKMGEIIYHTVLITHLNELQFTQIFSLFPTDRNGNE